MSQSASPKPKGLRVNEIFFSIQGESTWAGCPCVFVRLTGCPLRCTYCDTEYSFREGSTQPIATIMEQVRAFGCNLVEITGGEPLAQAGVHELIEGLCDAGMTVLIETSGAIDISPCDRRSIVILDIKTPGSGESHRNDWGNLERLRPQDEVKFVIVDREDYEWSREILARHGLTSKVRSILFSPAHEQRPGLEIAGCRGCSPRHLAEWILADRLPVRQQTQLHKIIWDPAMRGV